MSGHRRPAGKCFTPLLDTTQDALETALPFGVNLDQALLLRRYSLKMAAERVPAACGHAALMKFA